MCLSIAFNFTFVINKDLSSSTPTSLSPKAAAEDYRQRHKSARTTSLELRDFNYEHERYPTILHSFSRELSFRKTFRKVMSHFSRSRPSDRFPNAIPPQTYAPTIQDEPVEMAHYQDPCELPDPYSTIYISQMYQPRREHVPYGSTVENMPWHHSHQHYPRHRMANDTTQFQSASTNGLIPINTSVGPAQVTPSNASGHYISPNNVQSHSASNSTGVMLQSPETTFSSHSQISSSVYVSPTDSTFFPTRHNTGGSDIALHHQESSSNSPNSYSHSLPYGHLSHDELSTISPISIDHHHSNEPLETYIESHVGMPDQSFSQAYHPPCEFYEHTNALLKQHIPSSMHQPQSTYLDPTSDMSQPGQNAHHDPTSHASEPSLNNNHYHGPIPRVALYGTLTDFEEETLPPPYEQSPPIPMPMPPSIQEYLGPRPSKPKKQRIKKTAATAARTLIKLLPLPLPLLPCGDCSQTFRGKYQKANRKRHITRFHTAPAIHDGIEDGMSCRECGARFKRGDARRKHEWVQHRIEDSRPIPRPQVENWGGENRIYMPAVLDGTGGAP